MKHWHDIKSKYPDAIILLRCGDFYECYNEDAEAVSSICGVTVTTYYFDGFRQKKIRTGFPCHALDSYLPKFIRAGRCVALCDMIEDPRIKHTVKRGSTENPNND